MKIYSTINNLLIAKDTLIIPELGTLTSKEIPAKIDKTKGEITPPSKEISFSTNIENKDDQTLLKALIATGLSQQDAEKEIKDFVDKIKKLKEGEKVEIDGLGFFAKNKDGKISFITGKLKSIAPEAAGLDKIKIPVSTASKSTKKTKKTKTAKVKKTKNTKLLKTGLYTLLAAGVLVLLFLFRSPIINGIKSVFPEKQNKTQITDNTKQDTTTSIENNNQEDENIDAFGNDPEYRKLLDAKISNTADVYLGENFDKFYIIVGSFTTREYAENYISQLRKKGYNPQILNGTKYYRVAVGAYNSADNLIKDYNHYKSSFGKDIWILINRKE